MNFNSYRLTIDARLIATCLQFVPSAVSDSPQDALNTSARGRQRRRHRHRQQWGNNTRRQHRQHTAAAGSRRVRLHDARRLRWAGCRRTRSARPSAALRSAAASALAVPAGAHRRLHGLRCGRRASGKGVAARSVAGGRQRQRRSS